MGGEAVLFLVGLYFISSGFFSTTKFRYSMTVRSYKRDRSKRSSLSSSAEVVVNTLSRHIAPHIKLNDLRRVKLEQALVSASNPSSPEEYLVSIAIYTAFLVLIGLLCMLISPLITFGFTALAVYYAVTSFRDLYRARDIQKAEIEKELPRFTAYIKQAMKGTGNVLILLERYVTENDTFRAELSRTIADIRTSNFESAVLRFNSRYANEHLSMVTHGLIGLFNGDDVGYYFEMLERDLTQLEINMLLSEIKKIPGKMRGGMILVYGAIAALFFTPVIILIITSLSQFFG